MKPGEAYQIAPIQALGPTVRHNLIGSPVIIVQVRSHSPDSGSFQFSREPSKGERALVFHGDGERELRFSRFAPFVKSVGWDQATPFGESLFQGVFACKFPLMHTRVSPKKVRKVPQKSS